MKILQRTPELLVLADSGADPRMVGVFCLVIGTVFIFVGWSNAHALSFVVIGAIAALGGIALLLLPGRVTAAFDRTRRTLVITRRSLFRAPAQEEVDFSKIADVVAEPGGMQDRTATWRVTILLKDGARLPLTSIYTSSLAHREAAAAAREFLGLPSPPEPVDALPVRAISAAAQRTSPVMLGCMTVFLMVFVAVGGRLVFVEWHRLNAARPMPATVLSTTVESIRGSKGGYTYRPVVTFRYEMNGHVYLGTHVTPISESRSGQWAYNLVARYPVGSTVTAWVDPLDPGDAYLLHEWSFLPLIFVAFPGLVLIFVWGAAISERRRHRSAAAAVAPRAQAT